MVKMQVIGHLGQDAVLNNVNGKNVVNFTVAHSEKYKNSEGVEVNKSLWVSCSYWTDKTNIVNYLKKGQQIYVEGQPDVKTYKTKEGITQAQLTLRVSTIQLLGSSNKQENNQQQPVQQNTGLTQSQQEFLDDNQDLPF